MRTALNKDAQDTQDGERLERGRGRYDPAHPVHPCSTSLPEAVIELDCSKGTYVRALVDDLGRALGTGAVMAALTRTRVGPFGIEQARAPGRLLE